MYIYLYAQVAIKSKGTFSLMLPAGGVIAGKFFPKLAMWSFYIVNLVVDWLFRILIALKGLTLNSPDKVHVFFTHGSEKVFTIYSITFYYIVNHILLHSQSHFTTWSIIFYNIVNCIYYIFKCISIHSKFHFTI